MMIVKVIKDIKPKTNVGYHNKNWRPAWMNYKKGKYISISKTHFDFFSKKCEGYFELIGEFPGRLHKGQSDKDNLAYFLRLAELKASADLSTMRSTMKELEVKPFGK